MFSAPFVVPGGKAGVSFDGINGTLLVSVGNGLDSAGLGGGGAGFWLGFGCEF
jgi:hypothetical protein